MHFSGARSSKASKFIIVVIFIIPLASSFCPYLHGSITCDCDAHKVECTGIQNSVLEIQDIIANFSSVENVVIEVTGLKFEPDFRFENISIKNLTLGYGLESPPPDLFSELGSSLVSLNLNNNSIGPISDQLFSSLSSLTALYLDFNELIELEPSMFAGLIHLKYLSVASNNFIKINPGTFQNLLSLQTLLLSHNNISDIKNVNIKSSSLFVLKMDGCLIQGTLDKDTFSDLPNLEELDLSYNIILEIKPHSLASMKSLQYLNLSHNVIEFLQENAFFELRNLTTLDLKDNKISLVKRTSFSGLLNLKYLDLSRNRLKAILCDYTTDFASLEIINLQDNEIKVFTTGAFYYSPLLKELKLTGNNLECSCELTDTAYYLIENSTMSKKDLDSVFCIVTSTLGYMSITDYKSSKCVPEEPCKKLSHSLTDDDDYYDYDYSDETTVSPVALLTTLHNSTLSVETTETTTKNSSSYLDTTEIATPVQTSESVLPSENYTYPETTSTSENSTYSETTSTSENSTYPETTSTSENSTYPDTTSTSENSTYPDTTSTSENSTYRDTTSTSENSTYRDTTSTSENLTYPESTSAYPKTVSTSENYTHSETTVYDASSVDLTTDVSVIGNTSYENSTNSTISFENETNLTTILGFTTQSSIETSSVIASTSKIDTTPNIISTTTSSTSSVASTVKMSIIPTETTSSLTTKHLCSAVKLSLDGVSSGTDTGVVKNFTYDGATFCLKWTLGTYLPPKARCIIKYTFIKGVKSENLGCPKFPGDIKIWSKNEKVYKFCLNIYGASIGGSCIKVSEKTTPMTLDTTERVSTTDSTMFTQTNTTVSENLTQPVETSIVTTTGYSETPTYSVTESTLEETTPSKTLSTMSVTAPVVYPFIFNVTTFEVYFNDSSFVFVKWSVKPEEPKDVCNLTLTVTTQYFDHDEGTFPCTHHTHKLRNVREDDIFKLCLVSQHKLTGYNNVCRYSLAGANMDAKASSQETNTSRASYLIPLICLLVFMVLVIIFLIYRNTFRKGQESDRYDVRAEEEKSQVQIRSSSAEQSSMRYSYIAKENPDV